MSDALSLPTTGAAIGDEPVFHYQLDNFLPTAQYQQLCQSFPGREWFEETIEGNKKRINSRRSPEVFDKFCQTHPEWQQLFSQLNGPVFVESLYQLLKKPLAAIRGPIGGRPWRLEGSAQATDGPTDRLKRRAVMNFEFSRLENGSNVPPHTDAPEKLATLILYFAPPEWRREWGGGTLFYRPKDPAFLRNWHNRRLPFDQVTPVLDNEFVPNRLFIFTKSADSFHGLPDINCPPDMARNSVNINLLIPAATRFKRLHKTRSRWGRNLEQRGHPY